MLYESYDPAWGKVSRPGYGQKPYVRITLPDGRVFEGRSAAWADAEHVERIKRREASWQDPRDDYKHFEKQGEL